VKISLADILKLGGFDGELPTKVVRHQDERWPVEELRRHGWLELYQAYQSKPVFHDVKQIVSFYGRSGSRAAFYGVYSVLGHRPSQEGPTLAACKWSREWSQRPGFFYNLKRDARFDDLRDRLTIAWIGRSFVQKHLDNKHVLEILEPGRKLPPLSDYLEFSLTYAELKDLSENEEAHRDWREPLKAVSGVYLILARLPGSSMLAALTGPRGSGGAGESTQPRGTAVTQS
jgi:hypothetical protein